MHGSLMFSLGFSLLSLARACVSDGICFFLVFLPKIDSSICSGLESGNRQLLRISGAVKPRNHRETIIFLELLANNHFLAKTDAPNTLFIFIREHKNWCFTSCLCRWDAVFGNDDTLNLQNTVNQTRYFRKLVVIYWKGCYRDFAGGDWFSDFTSLARQLPPKSYRITYRDLRLWCTAKSSEKINIISGFLGRMQR